MAVQSKQEDSAREPLSLVRLGGGLIGEKSHACAFFSSADDEYGALLPFIKDGLQGGEKAFHTVDPARAEDHLQRLAAAGVDIEGCRRAGQFELRSWNEVHLRDGAFNPRATTSLFENARRDALERGFGRTRFVSHMGWCAGRVNDVELLEYEAQANTAQQNGLLSICVYDLSLFRADLVVDVVRTHPLVLVGSVLCENPYYVPPEEMLRELRSRAGGRGLTPSP